MRDVIYCEGWELYQYESSEVPDGFETNAYRLAYESGQYVDVSADKLKEAFSRLFAELA